MNGEGYKYHLHTGVERTNDKRSFIPRSPFFFFLLLGHLKATGSRKPPGFQHTAHFGPFNFHLGSFPSRICFYISQVGGITDPVACSQGQPIPGREVR